MNTEEKLKKIKELADAMYYAAQHLTTDASRLHKAMKEYHQFIINEYHKEEPTILDIVNEHFYEMLGEEPVSEDFKKFEEQYLEKEKDEIISVYDRHAGLVDGAKWQKEKMIAKAIDAQCFGFQNTALFSFRLPIGNYLVGSEVKVIVIKED